MRDLRDVDRDKVDTLRRPLGGEMLFWNGLVHVTLRTAYGMGWSGSTTFLCGDVHADTLFWMPKNPFTFQRPTCVGCIVTWLQGKHG